MRTTIKKIALALAATLFASTAMAQGACVIYEHEKFGGASFAFSPTGQSRGYSRQWNDKVSSVRVQRGCTLTLYEDRDFRGASKQFRGDVAFVGRDWNDRASSSECDCGRGQDGGQRGDGRRADDNRRDDGRESIRIGGLEIIIGTGKPLRDTAPPRLSRGKRDDASCVVFRDEGYRGPWRAFRDGDDDRKLGRRLSDKVSSVRVARGCYAVIDIGREFKLFVDQDLDRFGRGADDRAQGVSCFCGGL